MKIIPIRSIGAVAHNNLPASDFSVIGVSSRGIFLSSTSRWILFLSAEKFRGPLTINLPSHPKILQDIEIGQPGYLDKNILIFPPTGVHLDLSTAQIWEPTKPMAAATTNSNEKITATLKTVNDPTLNKILLQSFDKNTGTSQYEAQILEICHGLRTNNLHRLLLAVEKLIGAGSGLTPEGDDFIIGMILSLILNPSRIFIPPLEALLSNLTQIAYQKTTTISANLIECATQGQADERLIDAHNAIKYGTNEAQQEIDNLLKWGNTSGKMALLGISAGLLATRSS